MTKPQHFGWFFSRGFGPQAWGKPYFDWGYDWRSPKLYQESARALEQAGFEFIIAEDALSLGSPETLDLRVRGAYGGPKLDPFTLAPFVFAATERIGFISTINPASLPPYTAARQTASLHHLSSERFGINVVTDVASARHFGQDTLSHDAAYDRAEEWVDALNALWRSWGPGSLVADAATGQYADAQHINAVQFRGDYFTFDGPLNSVPFDRGAPAIASPGGSGRGLSFAGRNSDIQLAYTPLSIDNVRGYRSRIRDAAVAAGRNADDVKVLFWFNPEVVSSRAEADRVVLESEHPSDERLRAVLAGQSSDLETDLTTLDLDRPIPADTFGQHVSQGSINRLIAPFGSLEEVTLREIAIAKSRKRHVADGGNVGTAEQIADFIEAFGDEADNDGFLFGGDLHPVTIHRTIDELVPELRRRGVLRRELLPGGIRANVQAF